MHQHKTTSLILLVFFLLKSSLAAPAVVRERSVASEDLAVRLLVEDVVAASEKRYDPNVASMGLTSSCQWSDSGMESFAFVDVVVGIVRFWTLFVGIGEFLS
jgi:hypothetical protein